MKTINKIVIAQVVFFLGGLISYLIIDIPLKIVIASNIALTIGYLYGFWHSKNQALFTVNQNTEKKHDTTSNNPQAAIIGWLQII